jgi:4-amino-4-deoxy-L-arabinose transferase-like glycosyltransferase
MRVNIKSYFTVIFFVLISTFFVWLPFLLKSNFWYGIEIPNSSTQYIYRNFDGPLYIIPAKTFYNKDAIEKIGLELALPSKYFAAHLPLYPFLIRVFAEVFKFFGFSLAYFKAMIFVNLAATVFLSSFFYFFIKNLKLSQKPLLLSFIFLFIPKFLVVRSIGAPESLFMFLILLSIYFFEKERYFLAGLFGGLATMTKTPGILLFFSYALVFLEKILKTKKINWQWMGIFLIPLGLLAVFIIYAFQYKDFFAYFHSGDNIHLFYPFSVFNYKANWVGTAWLEEMIFYFFLYGLTVYSLKDSKYRSFFYFSVIFYTAILFVQHKDIPRYSLPLWPMALISFENFFTSKKFLIVFLFLLPAIYLFAWNFIIYNVMPISNWQPFL